MCKTNTPPRGGGGDWAAPTPPDEAENDGPGAAPAEDGSNVVSVDFKRKK